MVTTGDAAHLSSLLQQWSGQKGSALKTVEMTLLGHVKAKSPFPFSDYGIVQRLLGCGAGLPRVQIPLCYIIAR